jgi:large subunit ribosomal protein L18e
MKDNQTLVSLVENLKKDKKPLWKRVAKELSKPRRKRVEVNLSRIEEHAAADSTLLVPGKVLGSGSISKKLTVAAFSFSDSAKKLIGAAGGKAVTIDSLHKSNPEGKGVVLFK